MDYAEHKFRRQVADQAEADGLVADSMEVRKALMQKVSDGEMTLQDAQRQLRKIKRNAKKHGQVTRANAYKYGVGPK